MEYVSFAPLTYIYFNAGRRYRSGSAGSRTTSASSSSAPSTPNMLARAVATSVLHAHVAAPALCVIAVGAFQDILDQRIVKGALLSSVGAPCAWLSLALSRSPAAAACVAASYLLSLLAAPLAMLALCGRAAVPPAGHILTTVLAALGPFALGASRPAAPAHSAPQAAALLLLYADVCARVTEAEGSLFVGDVLTTLCLELCYAWSSVALCCAYARCGLLPPRLARTVAFCALPKAKHHGWEWSPACGAWGLGSLPGAMRAPALALLLAAAAGDSDGDPRDD